MNDAAASLRRCAVHESGHAVAAEILTGRPALVRIEEHRRGADVWHRGACTHATPATAEAARIVALAGAAAETLDGPNGGDAGDALLQAIARAISPSDAAGAGFYSRGDLAAVINFVRLHWAAIDTRARREIARFHQAQAGAAARGSATHRA